MGSFRPLRENQPVELELPGEPHYFRSRVEDVSQDKLVIAAPIKGGHLVPLAPGTFIKVTYVDTVAVYTYLAEIINRDIGPPATLTLGKPIDVNKIQRRNFVRLDIRVPVKLYQLDSDFLPTGESFSAVTVDLSGGGMMFTTDKNLGTEDPLEVKITLTNGQTVTAIGKVVRNLENPPKSPMQYSVGFEFISIEEVERDKIMRFIFDQQRELRRKRLL